MLYLVHHGMRECGLQGAAAIAAYTSLYIIWLLLRNCTWLFGDASAFCFHDSFITVWYPCRLLRPMYYEYPEADAAYVSLVVLQAFLRPVCCKDICIVIHNLHNLCQRQYVKVFCMFILHIRENIHSYLRYAPVEICVHMQNTDGYCLWLKPVSEFAVNSAYLSGELR